MEMERRRWRVERGGGPVRWFVSELGGPYEMMAFAKMNQWRGGMLLKAHER